MEKETFIEGYIVFDTQSEYAISYNNYYMSEDPDRWHIYPSERAAKTARTSCVNYCKEEISLLPGNKFVQEQFLRSQSLEVKPLIRKTTYTF